MPRDDLLRGRWSEAGWAYHVTTVVEGRRPLFADLAAGRLLIGEMRPLHDAGEVQSLAFVVMPDHLHRLFLLGDGLELSAVMHRLKGRSSFRLGRTFGLSGFRAFGTFVAAGLLRSCGARGGGCAANSALYRGESVAAWVGRCGWRLWVVGCGLGWGWGDGRLKPPLRPPLQPQYGELGGRGYWPKGQRRLRGSLGQA